MSFSSAGNKWNLYSGYCNPHSNLYYERLQSPTAADRTLLFDPGSALLFVRGKLKQVSKHQKQRPDANVGSEHIITLPGKPARSNTSIVSKWADLRWPHSALFTIVLALAIGVTEAFMVLGPEPLNPNNIAWLRGDPATYYIGWALFSQTPGWHWPLTFTNHVGFPIGDVIANQDVNSLAALLLKPFIPLLPATFQYFGIWAVISIALQFYFGTLLIRLFLGPQFWPMLLGGLILAISPVMIWRLAGHYALANHWLILVSLCLYFAWQRGLLKPGWKLGVTWCALAAAAIAINAYLAFCIFGVLVVACLRAILVRPLKWRLMFAITAFVGCTLMLAGSAIGVIRSGGGLSGGGYRTYSMNLLAPIDAWESGSLLLKQQPQFNGQHEGYNYLGLGILILIPVLVGVIARGKWRPRWSIAECAPLVALALFFSVLAFSTKVTAGSHILVDWDPHERLTPYLSVFRASGRFFWVPYYLITLGAVVILFRALQKKAAIGVAIMIFLIQCADESPLWVWVKTYAPAPRTDHALQSPIWSHLHENHANLLVFPPWQCSRQSTPGGEVGFAIFGILAAQQHMSTNSYYAARYTPASIRWHCSESIQEVIPRLHSDSVYVLSSELTSLATAEYPDGNICHKVDGFNLCSTATDFGLGPGIKNDAPAMEQDKASFAGNHAASKYLVWGWWGIESWGVWSNGTGVLNFRLDPAQLQRFNNVLLHLKVPVGTRPATYSIATTGDHVQGTLPGGTGLRVEPLSIRLPLRYSPTHTYRLDLTDSDPVRPSDFGVPNDSRELGIGIESVELAP